jgi:hypothetical protein
MQLTLEFENTRYVQIRRHYEAIAREPDVDARQFGPFGKPPPGNPS